MKRRSFLKLALAAPLAGRAAGAAAGRAGASGAGPATPAPEPRSGEGPYTGDEFAIAHQYLRDGVALPEPVPAAADRIHDVIVVGSGPSGLIAAWQLKDLDFLVLEKDRLPGGNSKMEVWNGIPYALGAAYIAVPDKRSALGRLYSQLAIDREWREFADRDMGIFDGPRFQLGYWDRPDARPTGEAFKRMLDHRPCEIPFAPGPEWTADEIREVDRLSWDGLLARGLPVERGKPWLPIPPHVRKFCALFARAVMSARPEEVSAWAMLNQFLAEFGPLAALPGGNGWITRRLVERLSRMRPGRIRCSQTVLKIEQSADIVSVLALGPDGKARRSRARALVFAGPKFVAARVVRGLPEAQIRAITEMSYRPFMVANVLLARPVMDRNVYDAYTIGLGSSEMSDITFADYAARSSGTHSVLTCYIPMARDDARAELIQDANLARYRAQLTGDLMAVLGPRGLKPADIHEIRFTRWGHPMVYPKPGQLTDGVFDAAARPAGRVFFAHQDNYGNPCIESCFSAASESAARVRPLVAASGARRRLGGRGTRQ
jgi:spermidine dehydrogenase